MRQLVVLISLFLPALALAQVDLKKITDQIESRRQERIKELEADVVNKKQTVAKAAAGKVTLGSPNATIKESVAIAKADLKAAEAELAAVKKNDPLWVPILKELDLDRVGKLESGVLSQLETRYYQVFKVIGDEEVLVTPVFVTRGFNPKTGTPMGAPVTSEGRPFFIQGLPTKGMVDGKELKLDQVFVVKDTKKYGTTTTYVLTPVSLPK